MDVWNDEKTLKTPQSGFDKRLKGMEETEEEIYKNIHLIV